MKRTSRATSSAAPENAAAARPNDELTNLLKPGEFRLKAPLAKSVKLAGNFTDWEKQPLDMDKTEHGVWRLILPLPPGYHPYRFIVDGQWCDDPQASLHAPNPFGTQNAVKVVT